MKVKSSDLVYIFRLTMYCFLVASNLSVLYGQQFNFRNYSVGEGLAQSQVYAMVEDRRGYIWMGTQGGGLSRFDGVTFTTFTSRKDSLANNYINALHESPDGKIWIGTQNGLSCYDGLSFKNFLQKKSDPITVTAIAADDKNQLWIGTTHGVLRQSQGEFISIEKNLIQSTVNHIYKDRKGNMWVGTSAGLFRLKEGKPTSFFNERNGLLGSEITYITEDTIGRIWAAVFLGGLHVMENGRFRPVIQEGPLKRGLVYSICFDHSDNLWVATQNAGVARWSMKDSILNTLNFRDGLANNFVRCMLEDNWGNLWFGTSGGGVSKFAGERFVHYDKRSGLLRQAYAVLEDKDCRIWIGNADKGVARYENGNFEFFDKNNGFINGKTKCMFEDRDGKIWLGTDGQGLSRWDDSTFHFFNGTSKVRLNRIKDMIQSDKDDYLIATYGQGIVRMNRPDSLKLDYTYYSLKKDYPALPSNINVLHIDKKERLWFGSRNQGLGFLDRGKLIWIKEEGISGQNIRSMTEDGYGYLWVGTGGAGVSRIKIEGDSLEVTSFRNSLTSGNVYLMIFDEYENLWIGSEKGLDLATLNEERAIIEVKHFGQYEGFVGIETCQNAAMKDKEGNLWFGTINGLTSFKRGSNLKNIVPPIVSIQEMSLFFEPLSSTRFKEWAGPWGSLTKGLVLPHDQNRIGFSFKGINHKNPDQVRYQWRLLGQEQVWSPPSDRSSETYSNLLPGDYRFEVRAVNEDGVWSDKITTPAFTILNPFWQEWWFILSVTSIALLIIFGGFKTRLNQVRSRAARDRERLEMEKNLLLLEQKALRLQMNPHFIFNALNSIQGLIGQSDNKTARYYLAKFSSLMRQVLENSREYKIPIEEEMKTLHNYLSIEQFCSGDKFTYSIQVDPEMDVEEIFIPPMMIQPFIENAIIHGISGLSSKGEIEVAFTLENEILVCHVKDNGVGRKKSSEMKSQLGQQHKSTALLVTQERLDILNKNGTHLPANSIEIKDLTSEEGKGIGTEVMIRIKV